MVKYIFSLLFLGVFSTVLYKQPSCSAINQNQNAHRFQLDETSVSLGKQIKSARLHKHLSEESFADVVGISVNQLNEIENGERMPIKDKLYKMEAVLSTTFEIE